MAEYAALMENEGRIHIVEMKDEVVKHKGLGVLNIETLLADVKVGEEVLVGQKYLTRMPTRLPELIAGMARRAQTISSEKLLEAGSFAEARNKGWLRSEGKEYVVNEGDVMEFLFNV